MAREAPPYHLRGRWAGAYCQPMPDDTHDAAALAATLAATLAEIVPPICSTRECAQIIGISEGSLRNRAYQGLPPRPLKVGRRNRYTRQAIIDYMTQSSKAG